MFQFEFEFVFDKFSAFNYFTAVYQPAFQALFTWSLITICGAMLMVQTELLVQYMIYSMAQL